MDEQPDFRRTWKLIYDNGHMAMRHEATYPSQDESTLQSAVLAYLFDHAEPLEKIQLVRLGLFNENYIDQVLIEDVAIPVLKEI